MRTTKSWMNCSIDSISKNRGYFITKILNNWILISKHKFCQKIDRLVSWTPCQWKERSYSTREENKQTNANFVRLKNLKSGEKRYLWCREKLCVVFDRHLLTFHYLFPKERIELQCDCQSKKHSHQFHEMNWKKKQCILLSNWNEDTTLLKVSAARSRKMNAK